MNERLGSGMAHGPPFERFTERAKRALALAGEEARRFEHAAVGTEHLLLGLLREGEGLGAKALRQSGLELNKVRSAVEVVVPPGDRPADVGSDTYSLMMSPQARQALDAAVEEAVQLGHRHVGTEHLLLGLLRNPPEDPTPPTVIRVLERLGVDREHLRAQALKVAVAGAGAARTRDNVVTCRVDDRTLRALDVLVEAGVHATRSEAAARLLSSGIEADQALLERAYATVAEIRRMRADLQAFAQQWKSGQSQGPDGDGPAGGTEHRIG